MSSVLRNLIDEVEDMDTKRNTLLEELSKAYARIGYLSLQNDHMKRMLSAEQLDAVLKATGKMQ